MPLDDGDSVARGCGGASVAPADQLCRRRARPGAGGARHRRAGHDRLHPAGAALHRGRRGDSASPASSPSPTSARPAAGRATPRATPARRWRRSSRWPPRPPAAVARDADERRRRPDLRPRRDGDRGGPARSPTSSTSPCCCPGPARSCRPGRDFPVLQGHDPQREGPSRRLRARRSTTSRRPRRRRGGALRFGASRDGAVSRCDIVLDLSGGEPLFPGARAARRLSARRPARPGGGRRGALEGGRPRRRVRQAALHRLLRRALRPFALAHHRLHPLPRALPDRRDHARPATMSRSIRTSAPAAAPAPPPARPAPPPTPSRAPRRLLRRLRTLLLAYRAGRRPRRRSCSSTTPATASR